MSLDERQVDLFSRQILLREVGGKGQERLLGSRVLLLGSGPAAEAAGTYLAGAGLRTLGLRRAADLESLGFAPLAERCPETRVDPLENRHERLALAAWDVVVEVDGAEASAGPVGRARRGSVRISRDDERGTTLLIVPARSGGCTHCHAAEARVGAQAGRATGTTRVAASDATVDAMLAGDLAALAALDLLLDLDPTSVARAFRLLPGAPAFTSSAALLLDHCPRACRA